MGSISIDIIRKKYPGKRDKDFAAAYAAEEGYCAIVRYKSRVGVDYDFFGCCRRCEQVAGYLNNAYCHDVEILYERWSSKADKGGLI